LRNDEKGNHMNTKRSRLLVVIGLLAVVAGAGFVALHGRTPPPESTATPPPAAVEPPAVSASPRRPLDDAFKAAMEHDSRAAAGRAETGATASP